MVASPSCWSDSRSSCNAEGWRWGNRGMAVRSAFPLVVDLAALLAWLVLAVEVMAMARFQSVRK